MSLVCNGVSCYEVARLARKRGHEFAQDLDPVPRYGIQTSGRRPQRRLGALYRTPDPYGRATPNERGDEKAALDRIYALFPTSRKIIKKYGPRGREFTKIAVVVWNQVVQPFTVKWHRLSLQGAFHDGVPCAVFREKLQEKLLAYTRMAGVEEDLTRIEERPAGTLFRSGPPDLVFEPQFLKADFLPHRRASRVIGHSGPNNPEKERIH